MLPSWSSALCMSKAFHSKCGSCPQPFFKHSNSAFSKYSWRMGWYSGCAHFLIMTRARSRGDKPRTSARPCRIAQNHVYEVLLIEDTHLFRDDDVQIVLCLVHMRRHRHNAADANRIGLAGTRAGRVHDTVLRRAQKVRATSQSVEHPAAHDTRAICVGVDVDLDGSVHADDAEATNDLGRIGNLLGAEKQPGRVILPPVVEAFEAVG